MIVQYLRGMDYGCGIDLIGERLRGIAIDFEDPEFYSYDGDSQDFIFSAEVIDSYEAMEKRLSTSASLDVKALNWGVSTKFNYENLLTQSRKTFYFFIGLDIVNPASRINNCSLRSDAKKMLDDKNYDDFKNTYGDSYISGFNTGARLFTILEFEAKDEAEKDTLATSLSCKLPTGITTQAGFQGKIETALSTVENISKTKILHFQSGGKDTFFSNSLDAFFENIDKFKKEVKEGQSTRLAAITTDYTSLSLPNDAHKELSKNISKYDLFRFYKRHREDLLKRINLLREVILDPDSYVYGQNNLPEQIVVATKSLVTLDKEIEKVNICNDLNIDPMKEIMEKFMSLPKPTKKESSSSGGDIVI